MNPGYHCKAPCRPLYIIGLRVLDDEVLVRTGSRIVQSHSTDKDALPPLYKIRIW